MINKIREKFSNLSAPARASIIYTICNLVQKGIAFCVVPIYTRIMNPDNYGYYTTFLSWMQVIGVIATLNLSYHVYMNGMMKYKENREQYTSSMLGLSSLVTVIVFAIYLIGRKEFNELLGLPTEFVCLMFLELLLQPSFEYWSAYQRFQYKYKALVILTLILTILVPVISLPLILNAPETQKGLMAIAGKVGVTIAVYLVPHFIILSKKKPLINREYWAFALKFNLPLIPHFLSVMLLQQSDRLMISKICGDADVAKYSVAYSLSTIMTILNTAILNSVIPWTYQSMEKKDYRSINKVSKILCLLVAIVNMLVVFIAPDIMKILAPDEYSEATYVIAPLIVSVYFMFVVNLFVNIEYFYAEVKFVTYGTIAAVVVNVILNYVLIPKVGFVAAGYTTLIAYILYSMGHFFIMKWILKKKGIDSKEIYDARVILGIGMIMLLLALGCSFFFKMMLIRYILLAIVLVTMFICRNRIIKWIKFLKN